MEFSRAPARSAPAVPIAVAEDPGHARGRHPTVRPARARARRARTARLTLAADPAPGCGTLAARANRRGTELARRLGPDPVCVPAVPAAAGVPI
ncbi:hypothetical protein [Embleya sp. AB8]|uniref:hypothetical protein n=1 Tax=Embleya sp. AB8 TaxID=3156304 RepID=UPI003C769F44